MNNYKTTQKEQILLMLQEEPRTSHCIMKENIFFNEINWESSFSYNLSGNALFIKIK